MKMFKSLILSALVCFAALVAPATSNAVVTDANGTVVLTATGLTTSPTCTAAYRVVATNVTIVCEAGITGTSNTTAFTLGTLPSYLRPTTARCRNTSVTDNSVKVPAEVCVSTGGVLTFGMGANLSTTGFTNSGTKAIATGWSVTFPLN